MAEEGESRTMPANISTGWQGLSQAKKMSIVVLVATVLLAMFLFVNHFTAPQMEVLFRGLAPDQATAVLAKLDGMAVPYEIGAGGETILVPKDQIGELRIRLSSDGALYASGVGFELFDQARLGITEAERRLNFKRALQGELQRTISQIEGIQQARVHLVLPEPSVFLRERALPTASVVLKLNPLARLREDQVKGIVYLVAGSVENLTPGEISVIDTQGRILSAIRGEEMHLAGNLAAVTQEQAEVRRTFEREIENRLQGMLERVLGAGTVTAMVSADLDFDAEEVSIITYGEPVIRSQQQFREEFTGTGTLPVGEAGTATNIPAYPFIPLGQGETTHLKTEDITNFEIPETVTRITRAPGEINTLSVSVIYDNRRGILSPRQMEEMQQLIATAVGYMEGRDSINVAAVNFDTTHLDETVLAMEEAARVENINVYIRYGLTALGMILGFFLILMITRRMLAYLKEQSQYNRRAGSQLVGLGMEEVPEVAVPVSEEIKKQKQVKEVARSQPEAVVSLLKTWMTED